VLIRAGTLGDADEVARVFTASFRTLRFLPRLHTPEEDRAFIAEVVLRKHDVRVAEDDGAIVGFLAMAHGDMVEHLYVQPERRREGIGTALLNEAKRRMPAGFRLWVFQENEAARRFYEKHDLRLVEFTDGDGNEEKTPDALYEWPGNMPGPASGAARSPSPRYLAT
jgi:ribosomal protein S18 acetylase RimI-like enzyme